MTQLVCSWCLRFILAMHYGITEYIAVILLYITVLYVTFLTENGTCMYVNRTERLSLSTGFLVLRDLLKIGGVLKLCGV